MTITAIVAAYDRPDSTRETIRRLQACVPPPSEILVHLDNGADFELPEGVKILRSATNVGPGGGRNRMIRESNGGWVASFDDDSYPIDSDYFEKLLTAIAENPEAGVIASTIHHRNSRHDSIPFSGRRDIASFVGCGCAYRKSAFLETEGYIPLPVAYGMEEVDLALQLHARGIRIVECSSLQVYHDTDLSHHETPKITAGSIMNQALLAWVRYPIGAFPYGFFQWLNKIRDNAARGRLRGVLRGIAGTPFHLWKHRLLRSPLKKDTLTSFRTLRRSVP